MTSNRLAAMVMAAGLALVPAGLAQQGVQPGKEPVESPTRTNRAERGARDQAAGTPTISVDFAGGKLEQFVAAMRGATKEPVNIVLQGEAPKIRVDAITFRDVSVEVALRAALEPRIGVQEVAPDGSSSSVITLTTVRPDMQGQPIFPGMQMQGQPVFVVGIQTQVASRSRRGVEVVTEVLSIQRLVHADDKGGGPTVPEQVVLSAIDNGLKLTHDQGEGKPEINYHKDSGLLLVRGQINDVRLVQDIVRKMIDDQQRGAAEAKERRRSEINRSAAMQRAQIQADLAERRMGATTSLLHEVEQQVKAGTSPARDLIAAQAGLAQAQAELQMSRIELDRLKQEAESGLDPGAGSGDAHAGAAPDVAQLQAELGKAMQRIRELEDQGAKGAGGKAKNKGE